MTWKVSRGGLAVCSRALFLLILLIAVCAPRSLAASAESDLESTERRLPSATEGRPAAHAGIPSAGLSPSEPARDPYREAARKTGVPLALLVAVAGAESGWHPWALNIRGHQYYCRSQQEAAALLSGTPDADIGLMQIKFSFWGHRLGFSKEQLLDPATNLVAGAKILKIVMDRKGSFWQRAGLYHSLNQREQIKWNKAVYEWYRIYMTGISRGYDGDRKIQ